MNIKKLRIAKTRLHRMKGLIGSIPLEDDEAILINRCNSIHTMFMKYTIDAIFLDKNMTIVGIENNIKPWSISKIYFKSFYVLELLSQNHNFKVGEQLHWLNKNIQF